MSTPGILVGLAMEARVLARALGPHDPTVTERIVCAGANAARARAGAETLLRRGAGGLVSFGLAGALAPDLQSGDVVLAESVRLPDGRVLETDPGWRAAWLAAAKAAGLNAVGGTLAGRDNPVARPADKRDLHRAEGAVAVDMESHWVAAAAAGAGVPFLVARAIADPADRALPVAAIGAIGADGRPRAGLLAARLARRPGELAEVVRLWDEARRARASLGRLVGGLGAAGLRVGP